MLQHYPKKKQQGFTIIEILVAVTLSIILLYGVSEVFLGSRSSYRLQTGMARAQENARFALDLLARNIGMAGANDTGIPEPQPIDPLRSNNDVTADTVLGFTTANGQASDTIAITYTTTTDCLGNTYAPAAKITEYYYLARDPVTNVSNLYCQVNSSSATTAPLIEGIENMQILYGLDTNTNDGNGTADMYVSANNVTNWNRIAAVRISLLASTIDDAGITNSATYNLLDTPVIGPLNDNLGRRVYTRTILLRNYMPPL